MKRVLILACTLLFFTPNTQAQDLNGMWYGLPRQPGMMDFTHIIIADNTLQLYHPNFREGLFMKIIRITPPANGLAGRIYLIGDFQKSDTLYHQLQDENFTNDNLNDVRFVIGRSILVLFYQNQEENQIQIDNFNVMEGLMKPYFSIEEIESAITQKYQQNKIVMWWQTFQREQALQKTLQLPQLQINDKKGFLAIQQAFLNDLENKAKNLNPNSIGGANEWLMQLDFATYFIKNGYCPTRKNLNMMMEMTTKYENDAAYKEVKQAIDKILYGK